MNYLLGREKDQVLTFSRTNGNRSWMVVLFLLVFSSTFAQTPEVRNAFRLIDAEQPAKGLAAMEKIVSAKPDDEVLQYYLGLAYIRTGAPEKALEAFEKGISIRPKEALNYAGKGHVLILQKKYEEGKALLDKAVSMSRSKNADVLRAVGEAYLADSKYLLDAISVLEKAKSINNSDPEIHILLGDAYLAQNNGGAAATSYERAASVDAKNAKANYKVGLVFLRSRNYEVALEWLNNAISIDPEFAPAYKEVGEQYYSQKKASQAVEAYEKYLSLSENPGDAKYKLAFFYFMAKNFEKANAIFQEVLKNKDASPTALKFYAFSLVEQKQFEEAKKILDQFFEKVQPEAIQATDYVSYAKVLMEVGQDSLANVSLARSLELDSTQLDILEMQAKLYMKRKDYKNSAVTLEKLIAQRKSPTSSDLWQLGNAYYFSGQYAEADTAFTKLAEKQPERTFGYLWAARARVQRDTAFTIGSAKPMYEKFIEIALNEPEKNKKDLIEAYDYLGVYFLQIKDDIEQSKAYFEKVLQLDPAHARANEFMRELKAMKTVGKG